MLEMLKYINVVMLLSVMFVGFETKSVLIILLSVFQIAGVCVFYYTVPANAISPTFLLDWHSCALSVILLAAGVGAAAFILYLIKKEGYNEKNKLARTLFRVGLFILPLLTGIFVIMDSLIWLYYITWAIMLVPYCAAVYGADKKEENTAKLPLVSALTTTTMLFIAATIVYGSNQSFSIELVKQQGAVNVFPGIVLACIAGISLASMFPFNSWITRLGRRIPAVSMLNFSILAVCGIDIVFKLAPLCAGTKLGNMLMAAGGFSCFAGALMMNVEKERSAASIYLAVANLGLILSCICTGSPAAHISSELMMLFWAPSAVLLFVDNAVPGAGKPDNPGTTAARIVLATSFAAALSLGIPPLGVFAAKWMMLENSSDVPVLFIFLFISMLLYIPFIFRRMLQVYHMMRERANGGVPGWMASICLIMMLGIYAGSAAITRICGNAVSAIPAFADRMNRLSVFVSNRILWLFKGSRLVGGFEPLTLLLMIPAFVFLMLLFALNGKGRNIKPAYICGLNPDDMSFNNGIQSTTAIYGGTSTAIRSDGINCAALKIWTDIIGCAILAVIFGLVL